MYDVNIKAVLNGWIIKVGCQTVVFSSKKTMFKEIGLYLTDPNGVEENYRKNAVNSELLKNQAPQDTQDGDVALLRAVTTTT